MEICGDGPSTKEDFYKIIGCGLTSTVSKLNSLILALISTNMHNTLKWFA